MSSLWLRRLIHVGLEQQTLRGLGALAEVIAQAAETTGIVLWEEAKLNGSLLLSVFAAWMNDGSFGHVGFIPVPDPTTLTALRRRTLAVPTEPVTYLMTSSSSRRRVVAALPLDWLDGSRGVLTLLGDGDLTDDAFDIVADLIDVLPIICSTIRERHTLALVNACNAILREADVASSTEPLEREQLSHFLSEICGTIADGLQLVNVSLFLREPTDRQDDYTLFASSDFKTGNNGIRKGEGWTRSPIEHGISKSVPIPRIADSANSANQGERALMVVPLTSGNQVWGAIECTGTYGPPFHFTDSDLSLLTPIAAQISQYWSHWLHRRETLSENRSWRDLASGITLLNKRIHDQLSQRRPQDEPVYQAAFRVIHEVVPGCNGADVRTSRNGAAVDLTISSHYGSFQAADAASPTVISVYQTGVQQRVVDLAEGLRPLSMEAGRTGWLVCTPIHVSDTIYGVLNVEGKCGTLPANSPQVCQIIGDQLGLYHYLRQTLRDLRNAQQKLEQTLRSQAETLEDLEHQLVSPLLGATVRTERVLQNARFDNRTEVQLRAVRGLCRRASRVALSAGVFSALSRGQVLSARSDFLGADDLLRLVILNADDAQLLINPRRKIRIDVDRASLHALGKRLVLADRSFLEQCVGNLLDNATKYSYDETTVVVGGAAAKNSFEILVSSTGIPLKPEDVEHCLKRNWRGRAARAATGEGSGLGLWIADNLMQSMRGRVEIATAGDATVVSLSIPYA